MKKVWKKIPGWGDRYEVSNYGEIRSNFSGRTLRPGRTTAGYLTVALCLDGKSRSHYVHVLVAQAFIPNPKKKPTVNHRRLPATDNRVTNLEWATYSENHAHAYKVLGRKPSPRLGTANHKSIPVSNNRGESFDCVTRAAEKYGVTVGAILGAVKRAGNSAGLRWWRTNA